MDQTFLRKLKAGTLAFALVMMMSACSSSQVEEDGEATAESVADASVDATTDEVPSVDPAVDAPIAEDPGQAPDGAAPEAMASSVGEEPPMGDPAMGDPGMADPAMADPGIASAPPPAVDSGALASGSSLDLPPAEQNLAMEPAPMNESGERDYLSDSAPLTESEMAMNSEESMPKKKRKKRRGSNGGAQMSGDAVQYSVKRGDTLMKIAFENYGDLYRWREIYEANRAAIADPNNVPPGTQLSLSGAGMVQVERNGEQYLIHRGETLGIISKNVYGTPRKWKKLWENNRELIKDPNKIYAGFYLYYQPDGKLTNGRQSNDPAASNEPPAVEGEASTVSKNVMPRSPASDSSKQ
jgi:nucleoid-associated protein YgaU